MLHIGAARRSPRPIGVISDLATITTSSTIKIGVSTSPMRATSFLGSSDR